jgi:hypothetical protein
MSTILGDKVAIRNSSGTWTFNDSSLLPTLWPGAIKMNVDLLPGWSDTVSLDVISVPRGVGDGNYTASRFPAQARVITIGGYIAAASRAALDSLWDDVVLNAFPQDEDLTLTRYEPQPKYVICRLSGSLAVTQYLGREGALRWEGTLLCSDPFKYDAAAVLSGTTGIAGLSTGGRTYPRVYPLQYITVGGGTGNSITLLNVGTARSYPVITITGPLTSGWRIENSTTGAELSFGVALSAGDVMVIDNQNKFATVNGSPVNGLLSGDWWYLVPGSNVVKLFADYNSTATFTVVATSRWR